RLTRTLAQEWHRMVQRVTHGDEQIHAAFLAVDRNRDQWNAGERQLVMEAEQYLQDVLKRYPDRE
ncbi:MerR family transcriptional regulator, partial [Clostridium perfringens]